MKTARHFLILLLGGLILLGGLSVSLPSYADADIMITEETPPEPEKQSTEPTKENFLSAWETHIKSLPTTVTFEKTDESGIYDYETSLFPYKGKLQLNNIIIDRKINYYYDYDLGVENAIKGVAEVTLSDISRDDLFDKYRISHQIWERHHFLFFDDAAGAWLSAQQWIAASATPDTVYGSSNASCDRACQVLKKFLPSIIFLAFMAFLVMSLIHSRKNQKTYLEKFNLSMERQLESIEMQKEQTALLKQLVSQKDQT